MKIKLLTTLILAAGLFLALTHNPAYAAGITVTTAADSDAADSDCSLREAIVAANTDAAYNGCTTGNGADTITFTGDYTITLGSALPTISTTLTIDGSGQSVAVSGNDTYRVFDVSAAGDLTVNALMVANGYVDGSGAGIYNAGTLTVTNSTISGSTVSGIGANGGGIDNWGTLTVINSTFYNNFANNGGAGIANESTGTATLINNTFSDHYGADDGDGVLNNSGGVLHISNNIIANSSIGGDCYNYGTIATNVNNLIETGNCSPAYTADPMLGPLQDNGGSTQTMALAETSPALDAGDNTVCAASPVDNLDQRGVTRPKGAGCDIGAYEFEATQTGPDFIVNTNADTDDGICDQLGQGTGNMDCTLREAINVANANADATTITFAGNYTITLTSALSQITTEITISGVGHSVTVDGDNTYRIFFVSTDGKLTVNSLTLSYGASTINNAGDLTVLNSTLRNGGMNEVGGIYHTGNALIVANSTFYNNSGIDSTIAALTGTVTINNSTFSGNNNDSGGATIQTVNADIEINNSIIISSTSLDCRIQSGGSFSGSNNLIDDNASGDCSVISSAAVTNLDTNLADNGGSTQTFALLDGSNAIDAGDNATCEATDQRGVARPQGDTCDIGAYEALPPIYLPIVVKNN